MRTAGLVLVLSAACILGAAARGPPVPLEETALEGAGSPVAAAQLAVAKQQEARLQSLAEGAKTPSYPSCVALCTSQKRALARQQLSQAKTAATAPAPVAKKPVSAKQKEIDSLQAQKAAIMAKLKKLGAAKHAARHSSSRKLMSADALNTAADDKRAQRLAAYSKSDTDAAEARKIRELLRERTRLLAYLTPGKKSSATLKTNSQGLASFQSRLSQLPFVISHETDCKTSCKAVRTTAAPKKAPARLQKKYDYYAGDCGESDMMIMPPDFPVRVVNKGSCSTCSAVCSALKFTSPWRRDARGSCSVNAEGDILDRYMRNYEGEVTLNLCTPMKGYDQFATGTPTVNGFNGDEGYVGAPAHTAFEEAMNNPGCCGGNIDLYSNSCAKYTACECDCCVYVWCNDNPYTWRY